MIGIDIVDVGRIEALYQRHGLLFVEKILNEDEIKELPTARTGNFFKKLSCYIAAKEAIYKASADDDLGWKDITIRDISGMPEVYIKKADMSENVKLTCAINRDMVISYALMI
jgi:holo-[acyl-carrier-protein] synthase